jgi:hypothetical protein
MIVHAGPACMCAPNPGSGPSVPPRRAEPVTRRYRSEPRALDVLVKVLRQSLLGASERTI